MRQEIDRQWYDFIGKYHLVPTTLFLSSESYQELLSEWARYAHASTPIVSKYRDMTIIVVPLLTAPLVALTLQEELH